MLLRTFAPSGPTPGPRQCESELSRCTRSAYVSSRTSWKMKLFIWRPGSYPINLNGAKLVPENGFNVPRETFSFAEEGRCPFFIRIQNTIALYIMVVHLSAGCSRRAVPGTSIILPWPTVNIPRRKSGRCLALYSCHERLDGTGGNIYSR